MPKGPVPPSIAEFLALPHFAVVATLRPDGSPHSVATWYDWEDGRILLNMDGSRARLGYLRADPRVAVTVIDRDDWYRHITLDAIADELHADEGLVDIDRLAYRYTGEAYKTRDSPRFSAWARVEGWHGWDASGARKVTNAAWGEPTH
jgi:PPOX class probable F420-dependent enzyme